jgi:hypothetical protein
MRTTLTLNDDQITTEVSTVRQPGWSRIGIHKWTADMSGWWTFCELTIAGSEEPATFEVFCIAPDELSATTRTIRV